MSDEAEQLQVRLLVLRCQTGDADAFTALVERYTPRLHYFVRRMLSGQRRDTEDVLQDIWLDVFRSIGRLVDAGAFRAWLYRIAHDRAMRELRRRRPSLLTETPFATTEPRSEAANADDVALAVEDAARIHAELEKLPPEQCEALMLRFLEDMSYEDIAAVTSVAVGTVRSRIHYAKRALGHALNGDASRIVDRKDP